MNPSESSAILNAIDALRTDVRSDIDELRQVIATMTKDHHDFQLRQAERNGEFANRDRAEEIAKQIHDEVNRGIVRDGKAEKLRVASDATVRAVSDLTATVAAVQTATLPEPVRKWAEQAHEHHTKRAELSDHVIRQVAGYLALVIAGAVLAALGIVTVGAPLFHGLGH